MISHEHKCIFIHIPKCAGSSFEKLLGHFDEYSGRERQDHRSVRMIQQPVNYIDVIRSTENVKDYIRRIREYTRTQKNPKNRLTVNSSQYKEYFKFTLIRNPWDRLFSWYKNVQRDQAHQKNYNIPSDISFLDFVKRFAGTGYLRPQTYWLEQFDGTINLDYVGKFEELDSVFSTVVSKLNLPGAPELPHEVHGSEKKTQKPYCQEVVDFIANYYQEEISLFDYSVPEISE
ncbi:sulfotransferase family 2 domain-containing protein [Glaciecola sp. 1036]|uniref:sulfotransferase family 2 domain-containing protein n=1 Tax=Alteromonadaceae TaxID=72275 RepID=UPI003CFCE4B4